MVLQKKPCEGMHMMQNPTEIRTTYFSGIWNWYGMFSFPCANIKIHRLGGLFEHPVLLNAHTIMKRLLRLSPLTLCSVLLTLTQTNVSSQLISPTTPERFSINRRALVTRFNPTRHSTLNATTPMQVGNGDFAFGTDITSLQTFLPFASMASWGWKNDSLPPGRTQADVDGYKGVEWLGNHGREVQYDFGGPADLEAWLRGSPNRVNLGRIGLRVWPSSSEAGDASTGMLEEKDLEEAEQVLDLWTGLLTSRFKIGGVAVKVQATVDLETDTVAVRLESMLVKEGRLGLFVDFPWCEGKEKFSAPFVGLWDVPERHHTELSGASRITHTMEDAVFYADLAGDAFEIARQPQLDAWLLHKYDVRPTTIEGRGRGSFSLSVQLSGRDSTRPVRRTPSPSRVFAATKRGWEKYWAGSGFVDLLTGSTDPRAEELQRRIILSRYLMRVNEAGETPPQEVSWALQC